MYTVCTLKYFKCVQARPAWAQGAELRRQLVAQRAVDPDEIFQQHAKTCSLDEVFDASGAPFLHHKLNPYTVSGSWLFSVS